MTIKAILFDKDGTLFHFNETWGPWFYDVLFELSDGKHDLLVELANLLNMIIKQKLFIKTVPLLLVLRARQLELCFHCFLTIKRKILLSGFQKNQCRLMESL
ncbi:MAG: hypothetical protein CM15mP81_11190 [Alphaproteobacteria bacterium]|nr:MAG: hypothetical protein CM15mP81_11190 [Alphaproteobacteria bacterium]